MVLPVIAGTPITTDLWKKQSPVCNNIVRFEITGSRNY